MARIAVGGLELDYELIGPEDGTPLVITPVIEFQDATHATGVWAMEGNLFWKQDGEPQWLPGFGFYHERYEKRDGR